MSDGGLDVIKDGDCIVIRDSGWEWISLEADEAKWVYDKLGELLGDDGS